MIEYNPHHWKNTSIRRGFAYVMMFNEIKTIQLLKGVKTRICDRRFYTNRKPRGDKWYWGWICFEKPLPLWDAMNAGLVPIFREGRRDK